METPRDVVLIGGGIMSATLGVLLQELEPTWNIRVLERLEALAEESSGPWNNAGTGHSALCELNYTPEKGDGSIDITKAVQVNEQFQVSRQLWTFLVEAGRIPDPSAFIRTTPHMSIVWGADNVDYLHRRYEALRNHPLFAGMQFSDDPEQIRAWAPLLMEGRSTSEPIAATFHDNGTDVDFGTLTRVLTQTMVDKGAVLEYGAQVKDVHRTNDGVWHVIGKNRHTGVTFEYDADFVFVGAGGGALELLQKSRIKEIRGFGGFPVSGEFLRTSNPDVVGKHLAKAYGKAPVGAPPFSVPHLDTRVIDGRNHLMFGPYAGWTPKFLKKGSWLDLFRSIKGHNLGAMLKVAIHNVPLTIYLIKLIFQSSSSKFKDLAEFYPTAREGDWEKVVAGQRVQVIRPDGTLQFGTEVITSTEGIGGLLGASPGASTATPIMLQLLERCFADRWEAWQPRLTEIVPTFGTKLGDDPAAAYDVLDRTAGALHINPPHHVATVASV